LTNTLDKLGKNLLQSQGIGKYNTGIILLISENGKDHKTTNSGLLVCYSYRWLLRKSQKLLDCWPL